MTDQQGYNDTPALSAPVPFRPENGISAISPASGPVRSKTPLIIAIVVGFVIAAMGTTYFVTRDTTTLLEKAQAACKLSGLIEDDGKTLSLDRVAAEENPGRVSYTDYQCILKELKLPKAVEDHIGHTRSLDGMQTDSWATFKARWNYHPDSGINLTITEE